MTNGLNHGFRSGFAGIIGLIFGLWIVFFGVVVGLGAIVQASPLAFNAIKWAGVAYLFYLGIVQFLSKASPIKVEQDGGSTVKSWTLISKGIALNAVNPKGYVFMLAVIPQFLNTSEPLTPQYLIIALTFAFTDLVVMMGYSGLAAKALSYLKKESHIAMLNKVFGILFVLASIVLATFTQKGF
jgi:homoserine/homoserine lactone efflux protein